MCEACNTVDLNDPSMKVTREQLRDFLQNLEELPPDTDDNGNPRIDRFLVRDAVQKFQELAILENNRLLRGDVTPREWESTMRRYLRNLHFTTFTIGRGGADKLTNKDMIEIRRLVDRQFMFLQDWTTTLDVENMPSEAYMNNRIGMYGNNAVSSAEVGNSLARGLPLLPAYPRDGSTQCYTNCKCKWRYNKLKTEDNAYNVFWVMGYAEHCPNCFKRSRTWNPLKYRDGVLVNPVKLDVPDLYR